MGINGLLPFLKERGVVKTFEGWPEGCKIAVDVPIFAYKFCYGIYEYDEFERLFFEFATGLKNCNPIFVFDGEKLIAKEAENDKRAKAKSRQTERECEKASEYVEILSNEYDIMILPGEIKRANLRPTKFIYDLLKTFLMDRGFEVQAAKFEAEALCAHLVASGTAWCALTEDSDALAFGCPRTVFKFCKNPEIVLLDDIHKTLEMNHEKFVEFCILLGCDFVDNVYKIGPVNAFSLIKEKNLDEIYGTRNNYSQKTIDSFEICSKKWPEAKHIFFSRASEILDIGRC